MKRFLKNLKMATRSVFNNVRQYSAFFLAMLIIQIFFGTLILLFDNNKHNENTFVHEKYNYHFVLNGLNEDQFLYLYNDTYTVFTNTIVYKIIKYNKSPVTTREFKYNIYISLLDDPQESYAFFSNRYYEDLSKLGSFSESGNVTKTPLLDFSDRLIKNDTNFWNTSLLFTFISVTMLTILYSMRINHYKFTYGTYITFGADYKKLYVTCVFELIIIMLVTYLPACLLCTILCRHLLFSQNQVFTASISGYLKIILFSIVTIMLSVWMPVKKMASTMPIRLLKTADNSNYVSPVKRSFNLVKLRFSKFYSLLSFYRFRKYNLKLLFSTVIFSAVFIGISCYTTFYRESLELPKPQFSLVMSTNDRSEEESNTSQTKEIENSSTVFEELLSFDGVTFISENSSIHAISATSHMRVETSMISNSSQALLDPQGTDSYFYNNIYYYVATANTVEQLKQYTYLGTPEDLEHVKNGVIITETFNNVSSTKFEPGDQIYLAKYTCKQPPELEAVLIEEESEEKYIEPYSPEWYEEQMLKKYASSSRPSSDIKNNAAAKLEGQVTLQNLLKKELSNYVFEYIPCTIVAVIQDMPTTGDFKLYMNSDTLTEITNQKTTYNYVDIYTDSILSFSEITNLEVKLQNWAAANNVGQIINTNHNYEQIIAKSKNIDAVLDSIARLMLLFIPIIWFFSQNLFYLKREKEFALLKTTGATSRDIFIIHIKDGVIFAVIATILSFILNFLCCWLMYYTINVILPKFLYYVPLRYYMTIPIYEYILSSLVCGISAFLAVIFSYIVYRRKNKRGGIPEELSADY